MKTANTRKIFGIGFHKTGTSTLGKALQILGYRVCDCRLCLIKPLEREDWQPVFDIVKRYDAFEDNPWPLIYQRLDQAYPKSKFILTMRDENSWIKSALNHFGYKKSEMRMWIYQKDCLVGNEEIYLRKYREHNRNVLDHFKDRPNDLLTVDWEKGDGWEQLCQFLGRDIPTTSFPHINQGNYGESKDIDFNKIKKMMETHSFRITNSIFRTADSIMMKRQERLFKKN